MTLMRKKIFMRAPKSITRKVATAWICQFPSWNCILMYVDNTSRVLGCIYSSRKEVNKFVGQSNGLWGQFFFCCLNTSLWNDILVFFSHYISFLSHLVIIPSSIPWPEVDTNVFVKVFRTKHCDKIP